MDRDEILKRPEIILTEHNYQNFVPEGFHPDNIVVDDKGVEWRPVRERNVPFKQRVVSILRTCRTINTEG